ncbi:uncharacterized protein si:dkeyp-77h1.4 [Cololabis saira]|uniref:uncharacterized protein si:dkeyp-77h1.4 n=1 Tax=Cololabis saira TaxID=129043 RepID=UPI002AD20E14|nr:uncharacterized protein si:dkeyp-77h1.4 [Cololabis saira]
MSFHYDENSRTLFHGEDFHILLPSQDVEVTFKNKSDPRTPVIMMRERKVVSSRARPNLHLNHLIIEAVGEGDEGVYIMTNPNNPADVKQISLIVRDCTIEQVIKYGDSFRIPLVGVNPPITVDYKPSAVEANETASPATVVLPAAGTSPEPYRGRIHATEHLLTLSAVTGADEGSYTVMDDKGVIQKKVCLNVKEDKHFVTVSYGERLKINLMFNSSLVQLYCIPSTDATPVLLMDKGQFTSAQTTLGFNDRLSLEGSLVILDQVKGTDPNMFVIKDSKGFTVSTVQVEVKPYRLESLYVAIIALLGLLAFLLLVCLLSCLIKVKKRAKRSAALEKLAENAGKEDEGEAFRQVVKNITKLSEESKHSQADTTEKSQSTEVDIKGLEVSSKEVGVGNLETSDSGVGFNTALPLDTDTEAADQIPDSEAASISVAPDTKPSPPSDAESKPSAPPALEIKSSPEPETKVSPAPETKKTPDQPEEAKLDVPKPADTKLSPASSPKPQIRLSPADPKPAPTSSPEPEPAVPAATTPTPALTPTPESKSALTPTTESKSALTPTAESKSALTPTPESKSALTPTTESKSALTPTPESKRALTPTTESKSALTPTAERKSPLTPTTESKSALTPTTESKSALTPTPESKSALTPTPESKRALTPTTESKSALTPTPESKRALTPTTESKSALTPTAERKSPLTPTPESKSALTPTAESKSALTPTAERKSALTPTLEQPKPTTPEPITNGTPEPGPDSKPSPDHAEMIADSAPKAVPPKTPEVELKSSSVIPEASKDGTVAKDTAST